MARPPLYMLTAVDVRRAEQTDTSRAVTIQSLTMPSVTFATAEHNPGGGVMMANFALPRIEAPQPAFTARGIDVEAFQGLGSVDRWVFAGSYRDRTRGNIAVPGRAIIEGAITTWEPDQSDPSEFQGCTHTFNEVTHYELQLDGEELFYVDFYERVLRRRGVDLFAAERRALGA